MIPNPETPPAPARPAASVIVVRDGRDGVQVLMVQRSPDLDFHGGAWVFPGGKLEPEDGPVAVDGRPLETFRRAAVREVREETGLRLEAGGLLPVSRWITPTVFPKRFDTWFFAVPSNGCPVVVDGREIRAYRWIDPETALQDHARGRIRLPPPNFVTLARLTGAGGVEEVLASLVAADPPLFRPRVCRVPGGRCFLYTEDAGYGDRDPSRAGRRHRLLALESGWRYEREKNPAAG